MLAYVHAHQLRRCGSVGKHAQREGTCGVCVLAQLWRLDRLSCERFFGASFATTVLGWLVSHPLCVACAWRTRGQAAAIPGLEPPLTTANARFNCVQACSACGPTLQHQRTYDRSRRNLQKHVTRVPPATGRPSTMNTSRACHATPMWCMDQRQAHGARRHFHLSQCHASSGAAPPPHQRPDLSGCQSLDSARARWRQRLLQVLQQS